jgi:hypothetical protein
VIKKMAQLLIKKAAQKVEEQEEEFIVLSPTAVETLKPEVLKPQAKPQAIPKKGLSRLFNRGKNNAKYLEKLVNINRLNARLDAQAKGSYRMNF